MFNGKLVRESTKQGNDKVARQMESAHRTALAKGEVGIRERKPMPTVREFISQRFEPWAKASVTPRAWRDYYRGRALALSSYEPLAGLKLDEITSESAADFAAHCRSRGFEVSTINASLRVLRRVLGLAQEWGLLQSVPRLKKLPGEKHRERVVTAEEELKYLAAASEPLASVGVVLADTGLRPSECFSLRWEHINFLSGRHGSLFIPHGKTEAARRTLPLTPRVRAILEARFNRAGLPREGWVWPAATRSGHLESTSLEKQHSRALALSGVRPFVLYSLRHTFLTRLGESGCDAWTLARVAGHSNIRMSARYVHPSEDTVLAAVSRLPEPEPASRLLAR